MAERERQRQEPRKGRPETEPYAPPGHPDVHVPEQQFEGDPDKRRDRDERSPNRR